MVNFSLLEVAHLKIEYLYITFILYCMQTLADAAMECSELGGKMERHSHDGHKLWLVLLPC